MPDVTEDVEIVRKALRGPRSSEAYAALARLEDRIRASVAREARTDEARLRERAAHTRIVEDLHRQTAAALDIASDHVVNVRGLSKEEALAVVRAEVIPPPPEQPPPPAPRHKPRAQR